ncbi:MAG TPA: hypothetical protein VJ792_03885 [Candidatus Nitrosotalea sp.]|nr:hypothetical protein [Candidatus Nitrosotalea sp.]
MYWTDTKNGTSNTQTEEEPQRATDYPMVCNYCDSKNIVATEGDVCCASCGVVLDRFYEDDSTPISSKLNLYQATGIGGAKVRIECARHIHERKDDTSHISNICVKLDLPIHMAKEIDWLYHKVLKQKSVESKGKGACNPVNKGHHATTRMRGCTKAHIAAYAVHNTCTKYGMPKMDREVLDAVRMELGAKKEFTMLKAYSLVEFTVRAIGISCDFDRAEYYLRLLLARLRERIGTGQVYDRISLQAFSFLRMISDTRANAKARRALNLAVRGAGLHVQV